MDGVLNSDNYFSSAEYLEESKDDPIIQVFPVNHYKHLDFKAIELMNDLVAQSKADVVLSSTWRNFYSIDEFNEMIIGRGANFQIIDKTPNLKRARTFRGQEVNAYLKSIPIMPEAFVILDDINEFPTLTDYFVRTNGKVGLTEDNIKQALKILKV